MQRLKYTFWLLLSFSLLFADHCAGQQNRQQQPVETEFTDRRRDHHNERAGGPADLEAAAAERRHKKSADDGGVEPAFRRDAGCNGDRHRQGQRDNRDSQTRKRVAAEEIEAVALDEKVEELRLEQMGCCCAVRHAKRIGE